MPRLSLGALLLAGSAVLVVACGGGTGAGGAAPSTGAPAASAPEREPPRGTSPATGAEAGAVPEVLAFSATTLDGGTFEGATLAGRDVVLWFWAPW